MSNTEEIKDAAHESGISNIKIFEIRKLLTKLMALVSNEEIPILQSILNNYQYCDIHDPEKYDFKICSSCRLPCPKISFFRRAGGWTITKNEHHMCNDCSEIAKYREILTRHLFNQYSESFNQPRYFDRDDYKDDYQDYSTKIDVFRKHIKNVVSDEHVLFYRLLCKCKSRILTLNKKSV
jgi:hypothetical protein